MNTARPLVTSLPDVVGPLVDTAGWAIAGVSRTGSRRDKNEDGWLYVPSERHRPLLLAIADGVGGEAAGERASAEGLAALRTSWTAWRPAAPPSPADLEAALREAGRVADARVRALTERGSDAAGAATTLTAAAAAGEVAAILHAGDSRAYSIGPAGAVLLTEDHTWITRQVRAGALTPDAARRHAMRNVIVEYLGRPGGCEFDVALYARRPGDGLLLCTDGATNVVAEEELHEHVRSVSSTASVPGRGAGPNGGPAATGGWTQGAGVALVRQLVSLVERRQGSDDATIVVAVPAPASDPFGLRRARRHPRLTRRPFAITAGAAGAAAVLAVGGIAARTIASHLEKGHPDQAGHEFLALWQEGQYPKMHAALTARARTEYGAEAFVRRFEAIAAEMTLIDTVLVPGSSGEWSRLELMVATETEMPFEVQYRTARFGEVRRESRIRLRWEEGRWRVDWSPTAILPELSPGRLVRAFSEASQRGSILDDRGRPLAASAAGAGGTAARTYPNGPLAGPVVGHLGEVSAEELKVLAPKGYLAGDVVGRAGVEAAAEGLLAGQRGGRLTVIHPSGDVLATLASTPPRTGETVLLSIDLDVQREVETVLGDRPGSAIVIDARSGAIRALASSPRYDPNAFASGGAGAILADPSHPLIVRPVQGQYPAGSTFKVITMAAALESGAFTPQTEFTCTGRWTGLPGLSFDCWLRSGHGRLDLVSGLAHSCNTVFYEIGKQLDEIDLTFLPSVATRSGFGAVTGVLAGSEAAGTVPSPAWKQQTLRDGWARGDAVNLAIGQGHLLVTPLQLAALFTAIGTGGTPPPVHLLDRSLLPGGSVERRLPSPPPVRLAWRSETLAAIRAGLRQATGAPGGTAAHVFAPSPLGSIVSGKTGTAESGAGRAPHAWFACYAPAEAPKAVVLVMLEHAGEGSAVAAPAARRILEAVFDRL